MPRTILCFIILTSLVSLKSAAQLSFRQNGYNLPSLKPTAILPQKFYNQHIGYMCKKENQVQKLTGLNVFIRLGSKNYVDYLEKKPNALKPY